MSPFPISSKFNVVKGAPIVDIASETGKHLGLAKWSRN
jgi:hypothetical protein